MEAWRRRAVMVWWLMFLALPYAHLGSVSGTRILVGGKQGWSQSVNYTQWSSSNQPFYVGDWLYFVYDRTQCSVLEVNRTGYESCSTDHLLGNFTGGAGRDVVLLNESRPYYFISGGGYCWSNMKLSVLVEENPPPAPAPTKNGSPTSRCLCRIIIATVVAWTTLSVFVF